MSFQIGLRIRQPESWYVYGRTYVLTGLKRSKILLRTIKPVQLEVDELQPPDAWHEDEQVLHLLKDHPARPVDIHLVVLPGKVARKLVTKGLDVGQRAIIVTKL